VSKAARPGSQQKQPESPPADLIYREVRREGKVVALFRGIATDAGVTVETRIFPVDTESIEGQHVDRPFPFATLDQARIFVDDSIVALEYLGCAATD
jgi:hypothetical protein